MSYGIIRVAHEEWPDVVGYHLYDQHHKLRLVADFGTPWLAGNAVKGVRFAKPSGDPIATLDLDSPARKQRNGRQLTAHAMILDHAVYAILNKYWDEAPKNPRLPYYVLEVADQSWLLWGKSDPEWQYKLYGQVPRSLNIVSEPDEEQLPEAIGRVTPGLGVYDFQVDFGQSIFSQPALMALAAIFLINFVQKKEN